MSISDQGRRTVLRPVRHVGTPQVRLIQLEVLTGPKHGDSSVFDGDPVRIGAHAGCDLIVADDTISGVHCELSRTSYGVRIRDLESTNGTFVDGRRIKEVYADQPVDLTLGATKLRLTLLRDERPVELASENQFGELVGNTAVMRALFTKLKRVGGSDATVLITGETGSGKELAAAAIFAHSPRKDGPFVVVDCGALSANLIESELLGYEQGAFTGAVKSRAGAFERAHGGTIFLDEIGELPLDLQPVLLGILERRRATRVGGAKQIETDVRVIAATNRDLSQQVGRGAFRADLYYRLAIVEVALPPLRERLDDIPLLVEHLGRSLGARGEVFSPETMRRLMAYPWPGNVRELRNVVEQALVLAEEPVPKGGALREPAPTSSGALLDPNQPLKRQKEAMIARAEIQYVQRLLELTNGNIAEASRRAGVGRMHLYTLIEKYQIKTATQTKA